MIEKRYYTAATLRDALAKYERAYGMTSAEFFKAHETDSEALAPLSGFERSVWAGLWQELQGFGAPSSATPVAADEFHTFQLA